jgi:hypothetical protein
VQPSGFLKKIELGVLKGSDGAAHAALPFPGICLPQRNREVRNISHYSREWGNPAMVESGHTYSKKVISYLNFQHLLINLKTHPGGSHLG